VSSLPHASRSSTLDCDAWPKGPFTMDSVVC